MIHSFVSLDLASVATLVMCERDVSVSYPSGMASTDSSLVAALFAYLSATSFSGAPLCAGTHRMVTLLSLDVMRQTSMAATAKRCPGPRSSSLTLVLAEVESTKTVYWRPLSFLCSIVCKAW